MENYAKISDIDYYSLHIWHFSMFQGQFMGNFYTALKGTLRVISSKLPFKYGLP